VEYGVLDILAPLQVPVHVLDRHGGIIDQDADRESESAERHDVDRLAERGQADDRGKDRQRYGNGDDDRAAPAAEEQQHHERGQGSRYHPFTHDSRDGAANEYRLIADRVDFEGGGKRVSDMRQTLLDAADDVERRGAAGL